MEFYVAGTKLVALSEAASLVRAAQDHRQTVVLCHGCFDIVHPGHIRHLQHAAKLGDRLLVTITGDTVVDKGTGRPLIPQDLRAENLAALDCVDWVAVNPEATAVQLLELVRPDVYVKGREYEHNRDPRFLAEKDVVERYGGRLVFTSGDVVFSSTALIAAMEQTLDPINHRVRRLIGDEGLDRGSIDRLLESFRRRRVTVVGETIIDTYVICDRPDVAGEGPIMTLRPVEYRSFDGGAAIIAGHLAAMGAQPTLVTALPRTPKSQELTRRLAGQGIDVRSVAHAGPIMEKQRFLVGSSKVMKLDLGQPLTLDATRGQELIQIARDAAAESDAVILADFGEGLFTSVLMGQLCLALRPLVDLLVGDVSGRRSNLLSMRRVDMLCPSEPEVREALHDYDGGLSAVVWKLLHRTAGRSAIVTLGGEGSIAFECPADIELSADDWQTRLVVHHVPALVPYAVDQLGCGDALLAAATLTRLAGGSLTRAAIVGAVAAAVESQQLGNAVIGTADLRRGLYRLCQARPATTAKDAVTAVSQTGDQLHLAHA